MHAGWIILIVMVGILVLFTVFLQICIGIGSYSVTPVKSGRTYRRGGAIHTVPSDLQFEYRPYFVKQKYHNILLTMLETVATVFEQHKITYWITAGTLLGALRHQGIIPWDDDVDLSVLSSDMPRVEAIDWSAHDLVYQNKNRVIKHKDTIYPYIDLAETVEKNDRMSFLHGYAEQYPGEVWPTQWIFPLRKLKFEWFTVSAPHESRKCVHFNYGPMCLKEVKARNTWEKHLPWIFNRRMAMLSGIH